MNENTNNVRWDRVALIGVILLMIILLIGWIQWNFGSNTAAWVMAMIFTTILIAAVALFVLTLHSKSQQNTAQLLHEFGAAQSNPYRVIEQQIRLNRDQMLTERQSMRLEDKQAPKAEWRFEDEFELNSHNGPAYFD